MKRNDITAILVVAAATMAFSLVTMGPDRVGAVDEAADVTPVVVQPKLEADGCVFTVKTEKASYAAGEKPVLLVTATNPTDQPVDARVWLMVQSQSPSSPMSRVISIPEMLWSEECPIPLAAGETKTIRIETEAALPAGKTVSIAISNQEVTLNVARLIAPNAATNGAPAVAANGLNLTNASPARGQR